MTDPLTPDDLARMRREHLQVAIYGVPHCFSCRNSNGFMRPGPCDAVRVLDEVERLRKVVD